MSRALRIEFPGAVYHVTAPGNWREPIYRDEVDLGAQFDVLAQAMDRFDAQVLAYCLMGNHHHLVLGTNYQHISEADRMTIQVLLLVSLSCRAIARQLTQTASSLHHQPRGQPWQACAQRRCQRLPSRCSHAKT